MEGAIDERITQQYISGVEPFSFGGRSSVLRHHRGTPAARVLRPLDEIYSYTTHRQAKRPRKTNPVYVREKRRLLQSDLLELKREWWGDNDGVKHLLMVMDSFTRWLWVRPLRRKSAATVTAAMGEILQEMGTLHPKCQLLADRGTEYINADMRRLLARHSIQLIHPTSLGHAPHVERANLSLQRLIYMQMAESGESRFLPKLDNLVHIMNHRYHRIIRMTPAEAEEARNRTRLLHALELYYATVKSKPPRFKVGEQVRIQRDKGKFGRGYDQIFTDEVFRVTKVHTKLPIPQYSLENWDQNEAIQGRFYAEELQRVRGDVFKVDKVIRTRRRKGQSESLVKWRGYPDSANSWIPTESLV